MTELTWIIDPATGQLVVEGLTSEEAPALIGDLLPAAQELHCAQPLAHAVLPEPSARSVITIRIACIYHGSVVEGPGRRSVVQFQGCPIRCHGCIVPETHDPVGGVSLGAADVLAALLNPSGEPRDGVTILGGEPLFQVVGLVALLTELKARNIHTVVYTGYRLESLARRAESEILRALQLTDLLIDGPFIVDLTDGAGEWRGSRNQRLVHKPGRLLHAGLKSSAL